jgi:hypothetical protein
MPVPPPALVVWPEVVVFQKLFVMVVPFALDPTKPPTFVVPVTAPLE